MIEIVVDIHYSWFMCIYYESLNCLMSYNVYHDYVGIEGYCIYENVFWDEG